MVAKLVQSSKSSFDVGIAKTVSSTMKWVALVPLLLLTTSCAWITGSSVHEDVIVHVPPTTTVQDVVTGDVRPLNWTTTADSVRVQTVELRNGQRHALKFVHDSGVSYRTFDLRRNWWGALNAYSPAGIGFVVDQLLGTAYDITPSAVRVERYDTLTLARQQAIEDSLRSINRNPIPHSVIDKRTNYVASVWGTLGTASKSFADFPLSPVHVGIGFAPIPYIMVLYEYGWMGDKILPDMENLPWGSYRMASEIRSVGVCVQEPVYGLFASWRYGTGFTKEYANEPGAFKDRNAWITHYSLGAGFYGQWGRIEYRMLRYTSWDADYANANVGMISHGLYFTTHIMF